MDLNGNVVFAKAYDDLGFEHRPQSINKISDANYILSDIKGNYSTNGVTAGLIKIIPLGDTLWARYFSSGSLRTGGGMAIETSDKGFVLIGTTDNGAKHE